jgi:hypothetical protein
MSRKIAEFGSKESRYVRVIFNAEYEEFIAELTEAGKRKPRADYHTDDKQDALATAQAMLIPPARKPVPGIKRINAALKAAGRKEKLTRNSAGGGYYYLINSDDEPAYICCSIYCSLLDSSDKDFNFAAIDINRAFAMAGLNPPLSLVKGA